MSVKSVEPGPPPPPTYGETKLDGHWGTHCSPESLSRLNVGFAISIVRLKFTLLFLWLTTITDEKTRFYMLYLKQNRLDLYLSFLAV